MADRPNRKYELIREADVTVGYSNPYKMLRDLTGKHHKNLREADIVLAWAYGWNPDVDGRLKLGQAKKASELDRRLHEHDFVIILNYYWWVSDEVTDEQRRALIDHELCHCDVKLDKNLEPAVDGHGAKVYRIRKHDIEEFRDVVKRHGLYIHELEQFAAAVTGPPHEVAE